MDNKLTRVDLENRLTSVQKKVDLHEVQIGKLFSKIEDTNICIQKIMTTMAQIKWTFYGAVGYYAISELGILSALKLIS